jgi:radical SAM protein with 4Fe4S-binding SPASM domain
MTSPPAMPGSYLVLETTGTCNLACVHCDRSSIPPVGADDHAHGGPFLDLSMAESFMRDLGAFGARFDTLILFWLGDPLLHPHFAQLYPMLLRLNQALGRPTATQGGAVRADGATGAAAQRRPIFGKIELHTNAVALSEDLTRVALNQAETPQVWHLTMDAVNRHTYRHIKGRDHFAQVERQVEWLIAEKGRLAAPWPRIVLQFIVSDRNADEAELFQARWSRVLHRAGLKVRTAAGHVPGGEGDEAVIFLRQLDCPTPEEQSRQNQVFRTVAAAMELELPGGEAVPEQVEAHNPRPCSGFWKSPVVRWNGDVTVCTRDAGLAMSLGNIGRTPFSQLWWGREAEARRQRVAQGDYSGLPLCDECFIPRSANYTGIEPFEIERHARWAQSRHSTDTSETP